MAKSQMVPRLKSSSGVGRKLVGLLVLVAVLAFVVSSPLEAAGHIKHVVHSLTTFINSL